MVYRRRRQMRKRGPQRKRPGNRYRRRYGRSKSGVRVFTEISQLSDLTVNSTSSGSVTGQTWAIAMASIPQVNQYKALYNEFKILKVKFQFIPNFGSAEQNQELFNSGAGGNYVNTPVLAYAVQRDASASPPLTELEVLTQNNAKLCMFNKPKTITVYKPQPEIYIAGTGGVAVGWENRGWMDFSAINVAHLGIQTYVTALQGNFGAGYSAGRAYAHITFALRDTK